MPVQQAALAVLALALVWSSPAHGETTIAEEVEMLKSTVGLLARQVMMQQFYVEEKSRSEGDSGLKIQRNAGTVGTRPYFAASHIKNTIAAIHDHPEFENTCGMGEVVAVLNGVEFRTRHNDYKLVMKSTTSGEYGATEPIPFPEVPSEVTGKATIQEQVAEMREWFRAWGTDNTTLRDYRNYFKPNLCYLEGQWIISDANTIEESFDSDRHFIDATTWLDLQEKIRHTSLSGEKDDLENFAYLPSTVYSVIDNVPVMAQWNYRILCHPVSRDIPLNRFRAVDDLKTRVSLDQSFDEHVRSRAARFQLNPEDFDIWTDRSYTFGLIDELMAEIPGHDNYQGDITDPRILGYDSYVDTVLNLAYYQSDYRKEKRGAMGIKTRKAGFNDRNLYVAKTTQSKVAAITAEDCDDEGANCFNKTERYSYAIPLEIVYTTPLSTWNPYNIIYQGDASTKAGKEALIGPDGTQSRNGLNNPDEAFNGINSKNYYLTPVDFFEDIEEVEDAADTGADKVYVLDAAGTIQAVRPTGPRIFFPEISGVGTLRQRFPIMPLNVEGSSTWKELEALKDIVLDPHKYHNIYLDNIPVVSANNVTYPEEIRPLHFKMQPSAPEYGSHIHYFSLTKEQTEAFLNLERVDVVTSEAYGHRHTLNIAILTYGDRSRKCDNLAFCPDGHSRTIERI